MSHLNIVQRSGFYDEYLDLVQSRDKAKSDRYPAWWGVALKTAREAEGAKSA